MRKLAKSLTAVLVITGAIGLTEATPANAAIPKPAPRPETSTPQTPQETDKDSILQYLREQYPDIELPDSPEVIWADGAGENNAPMTPTPEDIASVRRYPQAPDPFQVARDFGDGGEAAEYGIEYEEPENLDRDVRDAQLAQHWLDVREDLSLREIDRKALELVEEFSQAQHAVTPVSLQGQNGALSYVYGDHIPRILCRPNHLTDIALQAGEKVTAVHAGDTARWQVSPAQSGAGGQETVHVVIKPLMPDIRTNLLIMTDRRTYNLELLASESEFIPAARFSYPDDTLNSWNAFIAESRKKQEGETVLSDAYSLSPDDLCFDYTISTKDKTLSWKPVRVFDDGVKTYIEMPEKFKALEAPALMFYEGRQLKLVNYRVKDRYYIADRIMTKRAVLMAGQSRVVLERSKGRDSEERSEAGR